MEFLLLRGEVHKFNLVALEQFIRNCLAGEYVVVSIDPIYRLMAGLYFDQPLKLDLESSNSVQANFFLHLDRIVKEADTCLIGMQYFTKGDVLKKTPLQRISGGGTIVRDPDVVMEISRHHSGEKLAYQVDITQRNFPEIHPFCVRWNHGRFILAPDLPVWEPKKTQSNQHVDPTIERIHVSVIVAFLPVEGARHSQWYKKCVDAGYQISTATFSRKVKEAKKLGFVELTGKIYKPISTSKQG